MDEETFNFDGYNQRTALETERDTITDYLDANWEIETDPAESRSNVVRKMVETLLAKGFVDGIKATYPAAWQEISKELRENQTVPDGYQLTPLRYNTEGPIPDKAESFIDEAFTVIKPKGYISPDEEKSYRFADRKEENLPNFDGIDNESNPARSFLRSFRRGMDAPEIFNKEVIDWPISLQIILHITAQGYDHGVAAVKDWKDYLVGVLQESDLATFEAELKKTKITDTSQYQLIENNVKIDPNSPSRKAILLKLKRQFERMDAIIAGS